VSPRHACGDAAHVGGSNNQNQHHSTTYPIRVVVSINYDDIGVHTFLPWQEVCELRWRKLIAK